MVVVLMVVPFGCGRSTAPRPWSFDCVLLFNFQEQFGDSRGLGFRNLGGAFGN